MDHILPYIPYITAFSGFLTGIFLTLLVVRYRSNAERVRAEERIRAADKSIADLEAGSAHLEAELGKVRQSEAGLMRHQGELEALARTARKANEEKQALLEAAEERLAQTFETLSQNALQTSREEFARYARETIASEKANATHDLARSHAEVETIVRPVAESLDRVQERLADLEKAREGAYESLHEQVREMTAVQAGLRKETGELARALRQPGARGRWGDLQLRRVVELAGMEEYCDFDAVAGSGDGGTPGAEPDLIIKLPGGQRVFVDAQAPMEAYLRAIEAGGDDERENASREHAREVGDYLERLGKPDRDGDFDRLPEFSVLFFPGESVFSTALAHDPDLIEKAAERGVILATPSTLIALLRTVAAGWRQESIAANARAISDVGRELHDRVAILTDQFARVGRSLDSTVRSYNKALGTVESSVIPGARRLEDLGTASTDAPLTAMREVGHHPRLPGGLSSLPVSDEPGAIPAGHVVDDGFEGFAPLAPRNPPRLTPDQATGDGDELVVSASPS
ncbi:MAG: DNA recombination protein RmuC [Akkermansiaceae bacterium]|nr:DNA recombination protein RmuC [Akkermansiaceae bacterium]